MIKTDHFQQTVGSFLGKLIVFKVFIRSIPKKRKESNTFLLNSGYFSFLNIPILSLASYFPSSPSWMGKANYLVN